MKRSQRPTRRDSEPAKLNLKRNVMARRALERAAKEIAKSLKQHVSCSHSPTQNLGHVFKTALRQIRAAQAVRPRMSARKLAAAVSLNIQPKDKFYGELA